MFFGDDNLTLELVNVFKIERKMYASDSISERYYESITMRIKGNGHFISSSNHYDVTKEDLLYIPHKVSFHQSTTAETVIALHFMNYSGRINDVLEIVTLKNYIQVKNIMLKIFTIWSEKKPGYKSKCTGMLYQILYLVQEQLHSDLLSSTNLTSELTVALNYIHQNYKNQRISIKELAKISSISETYFRSKFKETFSIPPLQYINNLRLQYASDLLKSKLYSVEEVSEYSGFNDVKYFSRLFKQRYGHTPGSYKKLI